MKLNASQRLLIAEIKNYLDSEPSRRIHIDELVHRSGMSEYLITVGFRELYNITIYQYELRKTMEFAREMLLKGELVKTVAYTLEYKSPDGFSRAFFKVFNVKPGELESAIDQQ